MSPAPAPTDPSIPRIALLLGSLIALTVIGASAVAVALPRLAADLGLDTAASAWVLAAFSLAFSLATALFGRLADLVGLRLPLRVGVALLAAGSLVAAAAGSFEVLIAGRLLQGAGAGSVPVLGIGIVTAAFGEEQRGRALGGLTAVITVVSGSGPLIGGALTQVAGWRAVVAVPVVGLLLAEPVARLAPRQPRRHGSVDWRGAALVAATASGVTVMLQAPSTGLGAAGALGSLAVAATGAALLTAHVRHRPDGFLPRAVVTNGPLVRAALAAATLLAAYIAGLFALPEILASTRGWEPLAIGLAMLPAAGMASVASRLGGRAAGRPWARFVVAAVAASSALGLVMAGAGWRWPVLLVAGFALAAAASGAGQVVLLEALPRLVAPEVRGVALGTFNLVFFTGGAVGAAATGGLAGVLTLPGALAAVALLPAAGAVLALTTEPNRFRRR